MSNRTVQFAFFSILLSSFGLSTAWAGLANQGSWTYRTDVDLTKAVVHVAEYRNLTSTLALRCGGARGDHLSLNIGLAGQQLTSLTSNRHVTVDFNFRKLKGKTPQGDRDLTYEVETARAVGDIEMPRPADILIADALVLFDEVDITVHDPISKVFDMRTTIPLDGAVGPVRKVFRNCAEFKDLPSPGTEPAWHAFDEIFKALEAAHPRKPK